MSLVLLAVGCVSCKPSGEKPEGKPVSVQIRLVYPGQATSETQKLAQDLAESLRQQTTHSVSICDDILKTGETADPETTEIYLGAVERSESRAFLEQLPPCGYGWTVSGNKLLISAMSEAELSGVVSLFWENGLGQIGNTKTPFANIKHTVYMPEYLTLVENGTAVGTLSAKFSDSESYAAAKSLQNRIKVVTGVELPLTDGDRGDVVIVSDDTMDSVSYNSFGIRFYNGKIKLEAETSAGRNRSLINLESLLKQYYTNGRDRLCIPKDQLICWTVNPAFPVLPNYGGTAGVYEYNGNRMVYLAHSDPDKFESYIERLKTNGYEQRNSVAKNGNRYDTFTNGQYMLYATYTAYDGSVRLISASVTQYENMQALGLVSQANGTVRFSQLNIGNVKNANGVLNGNGMSYAFQLSDGSFVLIDGGNPTLDSEIDRLYDWLAEQTPEGQPIRIAAWLITHLHWDHIGVFYNFMVKYHDRVEVDSVLTNYPTYQYLQSFLNYQGENGDGKGYLGETIKPDLSPGWHDKNYADFESVLKLYFDDDEIIVPHTGQTMKIGNVQIEILYTHEDFYPHAMYVTNNMSVVYRITVGDTSFVFGGDAEEEAQDICVKINGSTMKSDYVQVNHHGYNGSVVYFQTIAPRVALLPNGGYKKSTGWGALLGSTANRWLARKVDQTVFAGDGITTVELKVG